MHWKPFKKNSSENFEFQKKNVAEPRQKQAMSGGNNDFWHCLSKNVLLLTFYFQPGPTLVSMESLVLGNLVFYSFCNLVKIGKCEKLSVNSNPSSGWQNEWINPQDDRTLKYLQKKNLKKLKKAKNNLNQKQWRFLTWKKKIMSQPEKHVWHFKKKVGTFHMKKLWG